MLVVSGAACGGHPTSEGKSLTIAAITYADAIFTGSARDVYNSEGAGCRVAKPTSANEKKAEAGLLRLRAQMQRRFGMSAAAIQMNMAGATVRDIHGRTGQAEVRYDLPRSLIGNDNWVTYELVDGKWKVQDCHLPIGGQSSSSGNTATP